MPTTISCDIAIVGGGLAGGLIALALARKRPELDVRLIEAGDTIGGNHLWSFFSSDVAVADRWIVAPLVGHAWKGYDVRFPGHARTLAQSYFSIESERLDRLVRDSLPPERVMTARKALAASPTAVVLADGDRIEAGGVIDARGPADLSQLDCGWQKFVGRGFELGEPHGLDRPVVMDASVAQIDGYHFVYVLPLSATEVFVEDTYYSDASALDVAAIDARIDAYVGAQGWSVRHETRRESGVLPVTLRGDFDAYWRSGGNKVAKAGMRAGMFQPATGYSLPDSVRLASALAAATDLTGAGLHALTHRLGKATWARGGFYRMLNTMLFRAAAPDQRARVIERFYQLAPGLVERFYAGRSTLYDKARILTGKPPVPVGRAIAALMGRNR